MVSKTSTENWQTERNRITINWFIKMLRAVVRRHIEMKKVGTVSTRCNKNKKIKATAETN